MSIQDYLYSAINPPMRALLRSPFHGIASRNLAILNYRGRKSGREFSTPLSFVREQSIVRLLSSKRTNWWKNFKSGPTSVEIEIARQTHSGTARLLDEDSHELREGVRRFLTALPRDAVVYGIDLDSKRRPIEASIEARASDVILVEIELTS